MNRIETAGMAEEDKKLPEFLTSMDIETELPENFDQLSEKEKISHLEELKERLDDSKDSGALKKRIIEELIRKYSSDT